MWIKGFATIQHYQSSSAKAALDVQMTATEFLSTEVMSDFSFDFCTVEKINH